MEQGDNNNKKSKFTVKNVVRILSVICIAFFFCPSFLISCSSYEYKLSATKAIGGVTVMGERLTSAHPVLLLCIFLPIIVFILSIILRGGDRISALIMFACYVADLIIWIVFRNTVKGMADSDGVGFQSTIWFKLNILSMVVILLLLLLVMIGKMKLDSEIKIQIPDKGSGTRSVSYGGRESPVNPDVEFCTQCGKPIDKGSSFCTFCGAAVSQSAESTQEHKTVDEPTEGN
jgi:hypothetical protein